MRLWNKDCEAELLEIYTPPPRPEDKDSQLEMVWKALFNGDGVTRQLQLRQVVTMRRLRWQDIKLNFILIFMALLLAGLACMINLAF